MKKLQGKIVQRSFINKRGKVIPDVFDLYLEQCDGTRIFIKTIVDSGGMTKEELLPYLNQSVTVQASPMNGELDSSPNLDYPVQSRIGGYLLIHSISLSDS